MNDLIGLEYCWGAHPRDGRNKTDCFQLVCEIRFRLGLSDYTEKFAWAYWLYNENTLKPRNMARWLLQEGERIKMPVTGAVALLKESNNAALGDCDRSRFDLYRTRGPRYLHSNEPGICVLFLG